MGGSCHGWTPPGHRHGLTVSNEGAPFARPWQFNQHYEEETAEGWKRSWHIRIFCQKMHFMVVMLQQVGKKTELWNLKKIHLESFHPSKRTRDVHSDFHPWPCVRHNSFYLIGLCHTPQLRRLSSNWVISSPYTCGLVTTWDPFQSAVNIGSFTGESTNFEFLPTTTWSVMERTTTFWSSAHGGMNIKEQGPDYSSKRATGFFLLQKGCTLQEVSDDITWHLA